MLHLVHVVLVCALCMQHSPYSNVQTLVQCIWKKFDKSHILSRKISYKQKPVNMFCNSVL